MSLLALTTCTGVKHLETSVMHLSVILSICVSVCLSVCLHYNSKMNDPKVFKLGIGNYLEILYNSYNFWGQKVKVRGYRIVKCKKAIKWPA